jgi:uncharacterized membrane protein
MGKKDTKQSKLLPQSRSARMLWILLCLLAVFSLVSELFIHRHPHFGIDAFFGFYTVLGALSCAGLILMGKFIGLFLKRRENYYQEEQTTDA